jgi:hypothetical protein
MDVKNCISEICEMYNVYRDIETKNNIDTGIDYSIHFDLTDYMMEWCDCQNEPECKGLLQKIFEEKGIFLGEFIKAVLKINNISAELEKVAETMCDVEFLDKEKLLGYGGFANVTRVKLKTDNHIYAMKCIDLRKLKQEEIEAIKNEI